jgi:hypothetical protein
MSATITRVLGFLVLVVGCGMVYKPEGFEDRKHMAWISPGQVRACGLCVLGIGAVLLLSPKTPRS